MEKDNTNKKKGIGCNVYIGLALIALIFWFVEGFISSGGKVKGGVEEISNEVYGWVVFIIIAFIAYFLYKIFIDSE